MEDITEIERFSIERGFESFSSHELSPDRHAVRLRIAPLLFDIRNVQTCAKNVRERRRADKSLRDGQLETQDEKADGASPINKKITTRTNSPPK